MAPATEDDDLARHAPFDAEAEPGFVREKIFFTVVIGPSGQLVGAEDLLSPRAPNPPGQMMAVPKAPRSAPPRAPQFLWDETGYALGVRKRSRNLDGYRADQAAFARFRDLQRQILEGVTDTALSAFLKFLDRWSPAEFQHLPNFQAKIDQKLVFRFQYDDEFLHERHVARLAWKRRVAARREP